MYITTTTGKEDAGKNVTRAMVERIIFSRSRNPINLNFFRFESSMQSSFSFECGNPSHKTDWTTNNTHLVREDNNNSQSSREDPP